MIYLRNTLAWCARKCAESSTLGFPEDEIRKESHKNKEEFEQLAICYQTIVNLHEGRGSAGQTAVDRTYSILETFVKKHPEFKQEFYRRIPAKHIVYDDGHHGMVHAVTDLSRQRRHLW